MHKRTLAIAAALIGLAFVPAAATAAADRTVTIDPLAPAKTWTGTATQGFNASFFDSHLPNACGKDLQSYCDDTLVHFDSTEPFDTSTIAFRIDGFAHSDYDLRVYESDKDGAVGTYLGNSDGEGKGLVPLETAAGDPESKSGTAGPDSYFLVRVVYFTVFGDETYTGHVSWTGGYEAPEEEVE